jgi:nucleoside-diphosphate-sugar epimerase
MPTTLITGANGFVGATVLRDLLAHKHTVVATVRSASSAKALLSVHPEWPQASGSGSQLTFLTVPDFTVPGAFDDVFKSHPEIEYVVHVAAPVLDNPANTDFVEHFEKPSVLGNLGLLQSAATYGKNVKSIAVVGSINAITTGDPADVQTRVFDSTQWLPLDRDEAISMQNPYV